jgi:PAS domain S-box-containing protein
MEEQEKGSDHLLDLINSLKSENSAQRKEIQLLQNSTGTGADQLAYQESQLRFRTIFELSSLGNKVISSDLKIIQINPAMVALLGYDTKEDILGTRILDYSPEDHHRHWALLQEHLWEKSTPSFSLETILIKKDGSQIWVNVTSIIFPDQGKNLGYTIIQDITEKHALRLQKEEFIGIASHELKTPITSLKAVLQLMNRIIKKEASIPEKIAKLAHDAQLYTSKLTHLVEDLLNSSKLEQGELTMHKGTFLLSDVIEGSCRHLQLNKKYFVTYLGDHAIEVYADRNKIDQVLVNFVNNAVKYASGSEEIAIQVEQLPEHIKISVTDKGNGIPPDDLPHLFERYYQVKKGEIKSSGLGLGLYISAEIIKEHNGEIGVESAIGKGSSFWFTLPISELE